MSKKANGRQTRSWSTSGGNGIHTVICRLLNPAAVPALGNTIENTQQIKMYMYCAFTFASGGTL